MIAFLEGELENKNTGHVLINVHGVGYRVEISNQTLENLPDPGSSIRLHTYHHFTDSEQRLFGFSSTREKSLFEQLITVKGVGPKLGLTILSGMKSSMLVAAIMDEDTAALSNVPGIGKKSAGRIVLELKDKILDQSDGRPAAETDSGSGAEEALSALEALGFRRKEAEKLVSEITGEQNRIPVSEIVKRALQQQAL